jgi:hypothetical protein
MLELAVAADLGGTYYLYAFDYRFDPPAGKPSPPGRQPSRDRSDLDKPREPRREPAVRTPGPFKAPISAP